jgi:hypothetical protein
MAFCPLLISAGLREWKLLARQPWHVRSNLQRELSAGKGLFPDAPDMPWQMVLAAPESRFLNKNPQTPMSVKKNPATLLNQTYGLRQWILAAALTFLLALTGTVRAQVTNIIYQDTFARVGPLDGSLPDTVNAPGNSWFACNVPGLNAQIQTDGSSIALTNTPGTINGFYLNGFLPFVPQWGHIYTLSCQIQALGGGNQTLAMGFAVRALTNTFFSANNLGTGLELVRGNGTGVQPYRFPGGSGNIAIRAAAVGTTTNLYTVVLDATTGTGAARGWTYRIYTNGVQVDAFAPANVAPTMIQYVGIGADAAQGRFLNFTLVDVLLRSGAPTIVEHPQNITAQVGQTATFWVGVTNDFPTAAYQWMTISGGVTNVIPGATNASYTTPALDMSYNGLNYSVAISNVNGSTNGAPAALNVVSGSPTVYSVTKTTSSTNLVVAFSKAVDPVTGLNPANYAAVNIVGAPLGVSILSAKYGSSSNSVILGTSTLDPNTGYYLEVQNVQDLYGNATSTSTNGVLPASLVYYIKADSGVVLDANNLVVQWLDQTTNANNASQFFGFPSVGLIGPAARPGMSTLNGKPSVDFGNQGATVNVLHFLTAPTTPSLESMISNTTMYAVANFATTVGNEFLSKSWGNLPAPFDWDPSAGENLQLGNGFNNAPNGGVGGTILASTPYVLSAFTQLPTSGGTTNFQFWLNGANNGNGVNRSVTGTPAGIYDGATPLWIGGRSDLQPVNPKMRGQIAEIMLFNTSLSDADRAIVDNYLGNKYFTFAITTDLPANTTSTNGFVVAYTFVAGAGSAHGYSFQWQENGTNIIGATNSTYTTAILAPGDNGDTFDVQVTFPDNSHVYSTTNTLTVITQAPFVTGAGIPIWNTNQIVVTFDESVDPTTASVAGNYSLNNSASVLSAAVGDAPNKVVLTTSPLTFNANPGLYSLTVQNVQDLFGNTITTASTPVGLYPNAALWIRSDTGVTTDAGTNTVTIWTDLSGNNNTVFGGGGPTIQPVLVTNTWGDPVVRFNQTDTVTNYLATASGSPTLAITGDMSIIAVINPRALTGRTGHIVSKTGSTAATKNIAAPYDYFIGTAASFNRGNGNGAVNGLNYGAFTGTVGPSVGYPSVVAASETGNTVSEYMDGRPAGTGVLNGGFLEANIFDQGQQVYVGARSDGFNRLAGDLSELIVASTPMSSGEVAALGNYLSTYHHFALSTPTPTNIVASFSNNQLTFSWPTDHTGWQLQSNSVSLTATGSWYTVTGSTSTNQITVPVDPTKSQVFYRMTLQQP